MFKRTLCAGGIIFHPQYADQLVIVNQKGTSWSLPKGHVETNESLQQTAEREVQEETGLNHLTLEKKLGSYVRTALKVDGSINPEEEKEIHMFLFRTSETFLKPVDSDNPSAKWVSSQECLRLLTHPKDREFFQEYVLPLINAVTN